MIHARGLNASIGANQVLCDVDIDVGHGEFIAVIGANGAGKTSLLRALSGLLQLDSGNIIFSNQNIRGVSPHLLPRQGLIHVPQGRQIIPNLSVRDNLLIGAQNIGLKRVSTLQALEQQWMRFPVLQQRQHIPGGALSGGEQQMLAIARGLMMRPKVFMLDEPSLGLAPQVVQLIMKTLRDLANDGLSIILVEQVAMLALEYADRGIVLRNGKCVQTGMAQDLLRSPNLVNSYLS